MERHGRVWKVCSWSVCCDRGECERGGAGFEWGGGVWYGKGEVTLVDFDEVIQRMRSPD